MRQRGATASTRTFLAWCSETTCREATQPRASMANPVQYGTAVVGSNVRRAITNVGIPTRRLVEEILPMSSMLSEKNCTPCRGGIPPLTLKAAEEYLQQAPEWSLVDGAARIERQYRFKNFREAFAFVERAAEPAAAEAHHPDISLCSGHATVSLPTQKIQSLHP